MKTIAIAGCGKLGNIVADAILNGILPEYELTGVYSRTLGSAQALAEKMVKAGKECRVAEQFEQLIALKPDYLIEAASPAAMREWALPTLKQGISIITLSIGAFADDAFYAEVMQTAKAYGAQVYVVSGATGGFDVLQTAANDVYEIEASDGKKHLFPAIKQCILNVDLENSVMKVHVMKGLMDL